MKRGLLLAGLLLIIAGCSDNKFEANYDKMQITDDGIQGYSLDLRIYGSIETKRINEIIRINNYHNKDYKITKVNTDMTDENKGPQEEIIYVLGDKTYTLDKDGKYSESKNKVGYNNPSIYLNGLKSVTKVSDSKKETIGETTYDVYDVTFDKKNIEDIIKDVRIENIELKDDVTGQIFLNKDGYVYRVIYKIGDLTINANYFGINLSGKITLPTDIEINE